MSELFPLEIRALAIAIFYSAGNCNRWHRRPLGFRVLIDTGSRRMLFLGYAVSAALMIMAAVLEILLGIDAEGR